MLMMQYSAPFASLASPRPPKTYMFTTFRTSSLFRSPPPGFARAKGLQPTPIGKGSFKRQKAHGHGRKHDLPPPRPHSFRRFSFIVPPCQQSKHTPQNHPSSCFRFVCLCCICLPPPCTSSSCLSRFCGSTSFYVGLHRSLLGVFAF